MSDNYGQALATTSVAATSSSAAAIAVTANLRLCGFSVKETTGTAGATAVLHNSSTNNAPVCFINLASGESDREFFGNPGIDVSAGVYLEVLTGSVALTLWTKK